MNKRTLVAIAVVGVMAAGLVFLGGAVGCSKGNSDSGSHAVATTGFRPRTAPEPIPDLPSSLYRIINLPDCTIKRSPGTPDVEIEAAQY